jgi:predicted dehydrogenase
MSKLERAAATLRVAVIGAGQIARRGHLPGYQKCGAQIVALCSRPETDLTIIAAEYGIERICYDWRGLLRAGGFDAVSICTPPALHSEMAVACARSGYHVLVEKPMALSEAQCMAMIDAADQANTLLMVAHNQRFVAHHRQAKAILQSGRLGRSYLAHTVFGHGGPELWSPTNDWYFDPAAAGNGVLYDLGSHKLDLLRWLLDQEIVEICAMAETFEKATSASDTVAGLVRFSGGTLATFHASWALRPGWDNGLTLRCERGVIEVPTEANEAVRILEQLPTGQVKESTYTADASDPSGWFASVAAFAAAVQNGRPSPVSGRDGLATMQAVLAASEACQRKTVIQLAQQPTPAGR